MSTQPSVVHISPHPDDEAIGAPGTLLQLRTAGWAVMNFVATMGRAGERTRRNAEARCAADKAGFELVSPLEPIGLSGDDDLDAAFTRCRDEINAVLDRFNPKIVIAPSPHDNHHAHEVVARATLAAFHRRRSTARLWLWGIWGELPFPTLFVPYGEETMHDAEAVVSCYGGELRRNDYKCLIRSRAQSNVVLGSERVFGFGNSLATNHRYADLLTECIPSAGGWMLAAGRQFDLYHEPKPVAVEQSIDWWLNSRSPHETRRTLLRGSE